MGGSVRGVQHISKVKPNSVAGFWEFVVPGSTTPRKSYPLALPVIEVMSIPELLYGSTGPRMFLRR